jgi:hypothetical protein
MDCKVTRIGTVRIPGRPDREIYTTESRNNVKSSLAGKRNTPVDAYSVPVSEQTRLEVNIESKDAFKAAE